MNKFNIDGFSPNESNEYVKNYNLPSINTLANESYNVRPDIFSLANAFLCIESMTHKKLQKLCYYAKGWYLAINDVNLISEDFEAWVHGAVQPELYQRYRGFGFNYIPKYTNLINNIPEEFLSFAREIYDAYGHLNGNELENLNHGEAPWLNARKGLKPWESSNEKISENDMKDFFRELMSDE